MKSINAMTAISVLFFSAACAPVKPLAPYTPSDLAANTLTKTIVVAVVDDSQVEIQTSSDTGCGVGRQKGCFYVPRNKVAEITYRLEGGEAWHFRRMQICPGGQLQKNCGSVDLPLRIEFVAGRNRSGDLIVPGGDGVIDLSRLGSNVTRFLLFNQNTFDQRYYYRLQACPDGARDTSFNSRECRWNEDPPIDNDGRSYVQ